MKRTVFVHLYICLSMFVFAGIIFISIILKRPKVETSKCSLDSIGFITDNLDSILLNSHTKIFAFGEQQHGDGSSAVLKTNLISKFSKLSHSTTLCLEASIIDWLISESTPEDSGHFLKFAPNYLIHSTILNSLNTNSLKIRFFGFDLLVNTGNYGEDERLKYVLGQLSNEEIIDVNLLKKIFSKKKLKADEIDSTSLKKVRNILERSNANKESKKYILLFNIYNNLLYKTLKKEEKNKLRDSIMAQNVIWYERQYKNINKIIIWSANFHILYNFSPNPLGYNMGSILKEVYKSNYQSIGITSFRGSTLNIYNGTNEVVNCPIDVDVEWCLDNMGHRFTGGRFDKNTTFFARFLGHNNLKKQWGNMMDYYYFINENKPLIYDDKFRKRNISKYSQ